MNGMILHTLYILVCMHLLTYSSLCMANEDEGSYGTWVSYALPIFGEVLHDSTCATGT